MKLDNHVNCFLESDNRSWAPFEIHIPELVNNLLGVAHLESSEGVVVGSKEGASTIFPSGFDEPGTCVFLAQVIVPA